MLLPIPTARALSLMRHWPHMIGGDPVGKILFRDTSATGGISYTIAGFYNGGFCIGECMAKADPLVFMREPGRFRVYVHTA